MIGQRDCFRIGDSVVEGGSRVSSIGAVKVSEVGENSMKYDWRSPTRIRFVGV